MEDKTIPDSAEPRLESFYPPFVAGIDLPHQGVVDSYYPTLAREFQGFRVWEKIVFRTLEPTNLANQVKVVYTLARISFWCSFPELPSQIGK